MKKLSVIIGCLVAVLILLSTISFVPKPIDISFADLFPVFNEPVEMFMSGDIMLGRFVETLQDRHGQDYPFEKIRDVYSDADIVFGNLEGPIRTNHVQTPDFTTVFSFEPYTAEVLARNGFTLMTLANNHTFDRGQEGLDETFSYLDAAGIDSFGHPKDVDAAYVLEKEVNGRDLVFIGFHDTFLNDLDYEAAFELVRAYSEDEDKFVFVSIHWGVEYRLTSTQDQRDFAYSLIDAGADLILGHHPHVVEEIEEYKGRLIFYSLGNFIFDQYQAQNTQEGLAVMMELGHDWMAFDLLPIVLPKSQPALMENPSAWLKDLANRSTAHLRSEIEAGEILISY